MKTKTVLRSLFLAYGLTGVCLLLLAFLVFQFDLGLAPVSAGIVAVYVIWQGALWQEKSCERINIFGGF